MGEARRNGHLGVMTSGGDCAGLNAAIRAVTLHAAGTYGWRVTGIRNGSAGLMQRPVAADIIEPAQFDGTVLRRSGTILGSVSSGDPFDYPMPDGSRKDRAEEVIEGFRSLGLDGLIVIGGDGSFSIMHRLAERGGIPVVGIPKTIDNDVVETNVSIGFHTAVEVATEALDRLQPTAASHDRLMILEVMGRDTGHIALNAGVAGGADIILIPEIPYSVAGIKAALGRVARQGRPFALAIVAEGVPDPAGHTVRLATGRYGGIGNTLAEIIERETGTETRVTVLGHVQRGAEPAYRDRMLASTLAVHAVDLLVRGKTGRMVAWRNRQVESVPFSAVADRAKRVSPQDDLVLTARALGAYVGDV